MVVLVQSAVNWFIPILAILLIYFLPMVLGIGAYFQLVRHIKLDRVINPPVRRLIFLICNYVLSLIVLLDIYLGLWSFGIWYDFDIGKEYFVLSRLLGIGYVFLVAPAMMGIIAFKAYSTHQVSAYHRLAFYGAIAYFLFLPLSLFLMHLISAPETMSHQFEFHAAHYPLSK